MNIYLIIIGILIIVLGSMSSACFTSKFTPLNLPSEKTQGLPEPYGTLPRPVSEIDTHNFDTRYRYPYNPPVNPMATRSVIKNQITASPDLYLTQTYDSQHTLIDSPPAGSSNELYYSGGLNTLIQIPLQYNSPSSSEQLRSQEILITPYNRIKYSSEPFRNTVF
jgi:hypothetical protein